MQGGHQQLARPTVLITGASRGLGAALALEYASPGRLLALTARDTTALEQVADRCRAAGAEVSTLAADVADHGRISTWIASVAARGPIGVVVANAGVFDGRRQSETVEHLERARAVLRVNLEGAIATVDAAIPHMIAGGGGKIVLVSSLAAIHPLADAPAYSASKAGLAAYGKALGEALAPHGIRVSVVLAGHIATRQALMQAGALPLVVGVDDAARRIRRAVDRGSRRIVFPRALAGLVWLNARLPVRLQHAIGRAFRFHVVDPPADDFR